MNLHEYQAKELLATYGLRVQSGILATNEAEAGAATHAGAPRGFRRR